MTPRTARIIAWIAVAVYFIMLTAGIALQVRNGATLLDLGLPFIIITSIFMCTWPILGALIVSRYPNHPIGWLLCLTSLVWAKDNFAAGYGTFGLTLEPGSLPALDFVLVSATWDGNSIGLLVFALLLLLFPTGRLLSGRWKYVAWVGLSGLLVYLGVNSFAPSDHLVTSLPNPNSVDESLWGILSPIRTISLSVLAVSLLLAVVSSILRFRRARGDERQQMKWIIFAAALFPLSIPFASYATVVGLAGSALAVGIGLQSVLVAAIGVAATLAIFKYRLYDLDLIINRALVYGALTGLSALAYFVSVAILQDLLRRFTGQESPIAIVASTLLVAVIFQPLRRRVQGWIDRRFYRQKYDEEKMLAQFGERMREEVDPDEVIADMLEIIGESLQPSHTSLWLRTPE